MIFPVHFGRFVVLIAVFAFAYVRTPDARAEELQVFGVAPVRTTVNALTSAYAHQSGNKVTPTIVALKTRVEDIKRGEVEKALARLAHLPADERAMVEAMASSIVNKLIHNTMVTLKSEVATADGAAFVEAARRFFRLGEVGATSEDLDVEAPTTRTSANKPG